MIGSSTSRRISIDEELVSDELLIALQATNLAAAKRHRLFAPVDLRKPIPFPPLLQARTSSLGNPTTLTLVCCRGAQERLSADPLPSVQRRVRFSHCLSGERRRTRDGVTAIDPARQAASGRGLTEPRQPEAARPRAPCPWTRDGAARLPSSEGGDRLHRGRTHWSRKPLSWRPSRGYAARSDQRLTPPSGEILCGVTFVPFRGTDSRAHHAGPGGPLPTPGHGSSPCECQSLSLLRRQRR